MHVFNNHGWLLLTVNLLALTTDFTLAISNGQVTRDHRTVTKGTPEVRTGSVCVVLRVAMGHA